MTPAQIARRAYIRALYLELEVIADTSRNRQTPKYLGLVAEIREQSDAFRLEGGADGTEVELELQLVQARASVETLQRALRQRRARR